MAVSELGQGSRPAIGKSGGKAGRIGPLRMFAKEFFKHPVMIGSIIPSSKQLINRMLRPVDWANTDVFVEYGPGVGTITRAVLERLKPGAKLIAIDTNLAFCDFLRNELADPRLIVINGSAADLGEILESCGVDHADYVLSGLPFSTLPDGVGPAIVRATRTWLRPGGVFLVYQFSPRIRDYLEVEFDRIDQDFEPINIPPARLYYAHAE